MTELGVAAAAAAAVEVALVWTVAAVLRKALRGIPVRRAAGGASGLDGPNPSAASAARIVALGDCGICADVATASGSTAVTAAIGAVGAGSACCWTAECVIGEDFSSGTTRLMSVGDEMAGRCAEAAGNETPPAESFRALLRDGGAFGSPLVVADLLA